MNEKRGMPRCGTKVKMAGDEQKYRRTADTGPATALLERRTFGVCTITPGLASEISCRPMDAGQSGEGRRSEGGRPPCGVNRAHSARQAPPAIRRHPLKAGSSARPGSGCTRHRWSSAPAQRRTGSAARRRYRNASARRDSGRKRVSAAEWQRRGDLAACYRLAAMFDWGDLIFTRISARVPGPGHHFLINPYGMMFSEITASSLVTVLACFTSWYMTTTCAMAVR